MNKVNAIEFVYFKSVNIMVHKSHIINIKAPRKTFIESKNVDMLKNGLKIHPSYLSQTSLIFFPNFFNFKNITGHQRFRNINIIFIMNDYPSITTLTNGMYFITTCLWLRISGKQKLGQGSS